jgi:hypothetical protein
MTAGNEISVSVANGPAVDVAVAGAIGDTLTVTNGSTASITVTSVGDRGPKGDTGPATTLTIGTVTAGAAGSAASATLTGEAPNQTLSLTLPRGQNGTNGTFSDAQSINAKSASYTLLLSDAGKLITASHASSSITVTVPAGSSVAFPVGTHIDIARLGAADVSVAGASGVTVNGTPGLKLRAQYSAATLILVASDLWLLIGDLSS